MHELLRSHGESDANSSNLLVHGDNRDVLRDMAGQLAGAVRCVYLDPPYNNQERYQHYDDRADHRTWAASMVEVLSLLRPLLTRDGSLWMSIDDRELHYLKVLADEVFGRDQFVSTIVWEHRTTRENRRTFSNNHEYLLVYARNTDEFRRARNQLPATRELLDRYRNPDNDPRGPWQSVSLTAQAGHGTAGQFYTVVAPNGNEHEPPKGRCWVYSEPRMRQAIAAGEVWFGRNGNGVPRAKRYLASASLGLTPSTLWTAAFAGTTSDAKRQALQLHPDRPVFDTPKPEQLISRILQIATNPGDLVLDPYLGSGTTAAVAHKMGRRWVGIEAGDHAITHCADRMNQVVQGDQTGISGEMNWRGGGSFCLRTPSLLTDSGEQAARSAIRQQERDPTEAIGASTVPALAR